VLPVGSIRSVEFQEETDAEAPPDTEGSAGGADVTASSSMYFDERDAAAPPPSFYGAPEMGLDLSSLPKAKWDHDDELPQLESGQTDTGGAQAFSPHLHSWSISRPYSAPPEKAHLMQTRSVEMMHMGFEASMEVEEKMEFFDLFKWRRERQLEGESAPALGGLKSTPRGSAALPGGEGELTPRRAYLDGCCKSMVIPVPLVRNCSRPRPISRTGR
jgi:hypothetical protein